MCFSSFLTREVKKEQPNSLNSTIKHDSVDIVLYDTYGPIITASPPLSLIASSKRANLSRRKFTRFVIIHLSIDSLWQTSPCCDEINQPYKIRGRLTFSRSFSVWLNYHLTPLYHINEKCSLNGTILLFIKVLQDWCVGRLTKFWDSLIVCAALFLVCEFAKQNKLLEWLKRCSRERSLETLAHNGLNLFIQQRVMGYFQQY